MEEAIAEAKAEGSMHAMKDDGMPMEHGIRTPSVDGLQASPAAGVARFAFLDEGKGARSSRAEEIQRGK